MGYKVEEMNAVIEELHHQQQLFFFEAKQLKLSEDSIKGFLEKICERISKLMRCDHVSIWLFDESRTTLTAQNIYKSKKESHSSGKCLFQHQAPSYFNAVQERRTLAVEDIRTDLAVQELFEVRFTESGRYVNSLLDATIILSRGLGGVLCCETEERRKWSAFDKVIITSITDMIAFFFDRLYRIDVEEHIHKLAFTDHVTGLDNEYSFTEKVTVKLQDLAEGECGTFLYMVLDQFTEIQGVLGHHHGEQVLKICAERIQSLFPEPAVTARIGFDHFIIYTPSDIEKIANGLEMRSIVEEIRRPMLIGGQEVYMTFSYGVSCYPDHANNAKAGLQAAQIALEAARKKTSRKASGIYQPGMHKAMKEQMLSEMNLRKGLDLDEFRLFYQPQVDSDTGELRGFEALIRWQHPQRGLIYPGDFIELAESTGLIMSIGDWVIKEAFAQLHKWKEAGYGHLTVSINLSPRHFLHEKLPSTLLQHAAEFSVDPQSLMLEITENVALHDREVVEKRIRELVAKGFTISIDDFGTGYSAFVYLQHFSVQEIKIDRQFIIGVADDPKSAAIVRTIISLAELLGLDIIAEGVETKAQWDRLKEMGRCKIQGYYFSRPLPVGEIDTMLSSWGDQLFCLPLKVNDR